MCGKREAAVKRDRKPVTHTVGQLCVGREKQQLKGTESLTHRDKREAAVKRDRKPVTHTVGQLCVGREKQQLRETESLLHIP